MDNSILHVTVEMKLVKGDPCYKVPNISQMNDSFDEFDASGSRGDLANWDIGAIHFQNGYDSRSVDHSEGEIKLNSDTDEDDAAFVTANDISSEPLNSSRTRKMSFSSPDVARIGIDELISPIPSTTGPNRRLDSGLITSTP